MTAIDPARDCALCPRLSAFIADSRKKEPVWHNAPVSSFGPLDARLLIVGLAPGLRGANRTGRPFTGDYAGDLLYSTLLRFGLAEGRFEARPDDSLRLLDARITNAVRCVPPENKPTPAEINNCRPFLINTMAAMPRLSAVLVLGRIAHDTFLRAIGQRLAAHPFAHGAVHELDDFRVYDSYHCSRYNTNTGVLTESMFHAVFERIVRDLRAKGPQSTTPQA